MGLYRDKERAFFHNQGKNLAHPDFIGMGSIFNAE